MADYTVTVEFECDKPLTDDDLDRAAELGDMATGRASERRLEATMSVENVTGAGTAALFAAVELFNVVPGHAVAVEAMTSEEFDRRLEAGLIGGPKPHPRRGSSRSRSRPGK